MNTEKGNGATGFDRSLISASHAFLEGNLHYVN